MLPPVMNVTTLLPECSAFVIAVPDSSTQGQQDMKGGGQHRPITAEENDKLVNSLYDKHRHNKETFWDLVGWPRIFKPKKTNDACYVSINASSGAEAFSGDPTSFGHLFKS